MRRSTAAAVGTLTGAALILGVRLSVQPPAAPAAAPAAQELTEEPAPAESGAAKKPAGSTSAKPATPSKSSSAKPKENGEDEGGLKAGTYKGKAVQNPYGTVQVTIKVSGGKVSSADATYPKTGFSGTINPNAVSKLNQETLTAQSAKVDAVSGATFTSQSYVTSLQAALDAAGA
ncbi:FMN-binding protein [Actinoplanes sp. NPDC020271]|uniref:FMN-binding protein n=1 Tax=Actinoplanes sp. NPDC020271 TaxID=3363896 RepID=UPI00378B8AD1